MEHAQKNLRKLQPEDYEIYNDPIGVMRFLASQEVQELRRLTAYSTKIRPAAAAGAPSAPSLR
ncbi:MAG: hypothetical protein OK454_01495 [Thaumarchaeota archaeon]|nr:hypothetical protein [Nitrososphaerota archaeon]